ncbi:MAG: IclR family transcriptional regulator [Candidatus Methylomirabilales bacterium]
MTKFNYGETMRRKRRPNQVHSVMRALSLLDVLAAQGREMGIVELSKQVRLHASTVHRLLGTLVEGGYAHQNPETGRYALSIKFYQLAQASLEQMDFRRVARPHLERIARLTGETANLVVLDQDEVFYVDKVESPQSLKFLARIGHRAPLYCTAVGKVLLAYLDEHAMGVVLDQLTLTRHTGNTITTMTQLRRELRKVRGQGFAVDREECEQGASCLAVPLRDHSGSVIAALGISGPTVRMTEKRIAELIPSVIREGAEVSKTLGFQGERSESRPANAREGGRA